MIGAGWPPTGHYRLDILRWGEGALSLPNCIVLPRTEIEGWLRWRGWPARRQQGALAEKLSLTALLHAASSISAAGFASTFASAVSP
jgi:hypothetical protein